MSKTQQTLVPAQPDPRRCGRSRRSAAPPSLVILDANIVMLRLANSQAPSTGANGAPRARPACGAASR
jgi:hypothetical protein